MDLVGYISDRFSMVLSSPAVEHEVHAPEHRLLVRHLLSEDAVECDDEPGEAGDVQFHFVPDLIQLTIESDRCRWHLWHTYLRTEINNLCLLMWLWMRLCVVLGPRSIAEKVVGLFSLILIYNTFNEYFVLIHLNVERKVTF